MKYFCWSATFRSAHRRAAADTSMFVAVAVALIVCPDGAVAQTTAGLTGTVTDTSDAVISGATVSIVYAPTNLTRETTTNSQGRYQIGAIDVGAYRVSVRAPGFRTQVIESLALEVGRTSVQDFALSISAIAEQIRVSADAGVDRATFTVGQLVDRPTIETTPLNGRHLVDLTVLAPGSVTPPQNGGFARPNRLSAQGINTAGHREETTNFLINGINLNDQWNNVLMLQPPLATLQAFRIDTATPSAEYGRNSGAVVNIATRSGTNVLHGSLFEYFRDAALDARNVFSSKVAPLQRHQFGVDVGGPIVKNKTFFLAAYEGVRVDQALDVNVVVPSDGQRASVTDPIIANLLTVIPRANALDASGTARFVGFAAAPLVVNQAAVDVTHNLNGNSSLHAFYAIQLDRRTDPFQLGNTIPGFGHTPDDHRHVLTLSHSQQLHGRVVNELRAGFNRNEFNVRPAAVQNPAAFGIAAANDRAVGLPQINVSGAFNFGGPTGLPQHNRDITVVVSDSLTSLRGNHMLKVGGEFRRYFNNNSQTDPGSFNFPSVNAFLANAANSFSILSGNRSSHVAQSGIGLFVQDAYKWRDLTADVGLRYEWNMTPTERDDKLVVFNPSTVSIARIGVDIDGPVYRQNNANLEPRLGLAWAADGGRAVLRGGYGVTVQQPTTDFVLNLTSNPPFAVPLSVIGSVRLDDAIQSARSAGVAPFTVQPDYHNATLRSWNLTFQRDLHRHVTATISYVGTRGRHLPITLNINQPIGGVRPYQRLSNTSPVLPGASLGNILQASSMGFSNYDALWMTLARPFAKGLSVDGSYTLSLSKDTNSLSSASRVFVQDSYNPADSFGPSDFDARQRYVVRTTYEFPWRNNRWTEGWQIAALIQGQSGNPLNIVTSTSAVSGIANTVRPDRTRPVRVLGQLDQWFDTLAVTPGKSFGNLPRNAVVGPRFDNVDLSVSKRVRLAAATTEFRVDMFNLFNHPNFGQPGAVFGSPNFGKVTNTRFAVGDVGSSRQVQLAATVAF